MSQKGKLADVALAALSNADDDDPPPDDDDFDEPPPDDDFDEDAPPPDDDFDEDAPPPDDDLDEDAPPPDDEDDDDPPPDDYDDDDPPPDDDEFKDDDFDDFDEPPPDDDDMPPPDDNDDNLSMSSGTSGSTVAEEAVKKAPPPPPKIASRASLATNNISSLMQSPSSHLSTIVEENLLDGDIGTGFTRNNIGAIDAVSDENDNDSASSVMKSSGSIEGKSQVVKPVDRSASIRGSMRSSMIRPSHEKIQKVAHAAKTEGFIEINGKFEGDAFERLFIKILNNVFLIRVETGQEIELDLINRKAHVTEDPQDEYCFVLEIEKHVIIWKTANVEDRSNLLLQLPKQVVDADTSEYASPAPETATNNTSKKVYVYPDENDQRALLKKAGKSFDDLLEGDIGSPVKISIARQERALFSTSGSSVSGDSYRPRVDNNSLRKVTYNRIELINSHIKQPIYSVRRAKQLCKWINGMHIWHSPLSLSSIHEDFCNGLLLRNLMKKLMILPPDAIIPVNEKPLTTAIAHENLEKVLGLILRSKHVNKSRIPSSKELLYGSSAKLVILLQELFDVYLRKPLYGRAVKIMKWYDTVLRPFGVSMPDEIFDKEKGDLGGLWSLFQSGTLLFKVIYYFYAYSTIGEGMNIIAVDSLRIFEQPASISEYRSNMIYVFSLLRALKIEVIWDEDDWISYPDTEFLLLQLTYIYDVLKDLTPSLPPAEKGNPGLTSGPNGSSQVVGMVFADTTVSNVLPRYSKGVLMGNGDNSLPFLPIDMTGRKNPRLVSEVCPLGLMSSKVKLTFINSPIASSPNKERLRWNVGTKSDISSENHKDKPLIDIFKRHYQTLHRLLSNNGGSEYTYTGRRDRSYSISSSSAIVGLYHQSETDDEIFRKGRLDLSDMMQTLEDDIYKSEEGMKSLEEDLTSRYLELESLSESIDVQQYTVRLEELESERFKLDVEREKLQELFMRRLQSIKVRQAELEAKEESYTNNIVQAQVQAQSQINQAGSPDPKSTLKFTSPSNKKLHQSIEKEKLGERGWISDVTHSSTMNFHLRNLVENSKNLKESWTPKANRFKDNGRDSTGNQDTPAGSMADNSPIAHGGGDGGEKSKSVEKAKSKQQPTMSVTAAAGRRGDSSIVALKLLAGNNPINSAFHKFLVRLKRVDDDWKVKYEKVKYAVMYRRPSVELRREPKDQGTGDLIAVPPPPSGYNSEIHDVIRQESLVLMRLEDERRKRWYLYNRNGNNPNLLSNQLMSPSYLSPADNNTSFSNSSTNNSHNSSYFGSPVGSPYGNSANNSSPQRDSRHSYFDNIDTSPLPMPPRGGGGGAATRSSSLAQKEEKFSDDRDRETFDKIETSLGLQPSLQWLSTSRPLILSDRKNREYLFHVTEMTQHNLDRGDKDKTWSLVWREPALQFTDHSSIAGQLSLTSIKDVSLTENEPTTLLITIIESPKALRLTGGRPSIMLKCKSSGESAKYRNALKTVLRAISLNMKLGE